MDNYHIQIGKDAATQDLIISLDARIELSDILIHGPEQCITELVLKLHAALLSETVQ